MKITPYELDFYKWTHDQETLLRNREFAKLDIDNLIDEIASLGSCIEYLLEHYLEKLLICFIKKRFNLEEDIRSLNLYIQYLNLRLNDLLSENQSLKSQLKEHVDFIYISAKYRVCIEKETDFQDFPEKCPWELKEIFTDLEEKYW